MNPSVIVLIPLLNTKCRDGDKNFEENKKTKENFVSFLKQAENFYVIPLLLWTQFLLKMISFLAHIDNQGGYAWNLPPQSRKRAKNSCFLLKSSSLPLL